jgi:UTP--glucose-1-phosphate uridylyltransferase
MSSSITGPIGQRAFWSALVPAAGRATRFLPTTKMVPKELLPVDTPAIEYVGEEALRLARKGWCSSSPRAKSRWRHLDPSPDLEASSQD